MRYFCRRLKKKQLLRGEYKHAHYTYIPIQLSTGVIICYDCNLIVLGDEIILFMKANYTFSRSLYSRDGYKHYIYTFVHTYII